jgi:hypothetical protein
MSETVEGITKKMEEKIRSRKSAYPGETQAEKWVHIYKILFPGDEEIPSPCKSLESKRITRLSKAYYLRLRSNTRKRRRIS